MENKKGTFYIVGVGPGDPELLTIKACRVLEECPVIAAPQTASGQQLALSIVGRAVDLRQKHLISLCFPMVRDAGEREANIRTQAQILFPYLEQGEDVAMVNLGDVSIYSTAYYLLEVVKEAGFPVRMVPGVPSFCAVAAALETSLTEINQPFHVIPASGMDFEDALALPGTKVLMKAGKSVSQCVEALKEHGLIEHAALVSNCGLENEQIVQDLRKLPEDVGYFTTIVVK